MNKKMIEYVEECGQLEFSTGCSLISIKLDYLFLVSMFIYSTFDVTSTLLDRILKAL